MSQDQDVIIDRDIKALLYTEPICGIANINLHNKLMKQDYKFLLWPYL